MKLNNPIGYRISYHNHTTWSDGAPTVAALIQAARKLGLDELGISDHYVLSPGSGEGEELEPEAPWSMSPDLLGDYVLQLRAAAAETRDLTIRIGIEADFFPESVGELRRILAEYPFDFVIGSVHFVDGFPVDETARLWDALSEEQRNETWRRYWQLMRQMAQSGAFDFAAHLDLPKKFGHGPSIDLAAVRDSALDAIADAGMAIEINTAGWSLPAREAYPSLLVLSAARARGIPLLITADAHFPEFLTRDFERARELALTAGYTSLVRYQRRIPLSYPL